jgi:fatty acid-binding protein DegV
LLNPPKTWRGKKAKTAKGEREKQTSKPHPQVLIKTHQQIKRMSEDFLLCLHGKTFSPFHQSRAHSKSTKIERKAKQIVCCKL